MAEALDGLEARGLPLDALRIRAFPFHDEILEFIAAHEKVFVVEQNRDGQLRTLLVSEGSVDPAKLVPVLHYDGSPITARFILSRIANQLDPANVTPLRKNVAG
jgi:2-oxoglutarate/2-oxoacid ferredoxin oxidoreductase subunit alpha